MKQGEGRNRWIGQGAESMVQDSGGKQGEAGGRAPKSQKRLPLTEVTENAMRQPKKLIHWKQT